MSSEHNMKTTETSQYKNWKRIIQSAQKFPIEKHVSEIEALHESRKVRTLHGGNCSSQTMIEACAVDINVRARVVELLVVAKRLNYSVSQGNDGLKAWMAFSGRAEGKTRDERDQHVRFIIRQGLKIKSDLMAFIDHCDELLRDIDQSGWGMRLMMDGVKMANKPEIMPGG